jgi:transcriptional regulator with XRE-family HTH domain
VTATVPGNRAQRWTTIANGQRIRELRRQCGLAQAELAGLAGASLDTVARLERQHRTACRMRTLARIAAALGEPPATIAAVILEDPVTRSVRRGAKQHGDRRGCAGPPKSKVGRRMADTPHGIVPVLRAHLSILVKDEPGALAFPGVMGGPLRRGNCNKMSAWPYAVRSIGAEGHPGDEIPQARPARCRERAARMAQIVEVQHDSERAAMIYQHEARGADQAITRAIDTHVQAEQRDEDDGQAGVLAPGG